jgi:putative addiction module component (TIGR02574 family)
MSSVRSQIPKEFRELSAKARIEYVQSLWNFIAKTPDQVPIPESHKRVLDQRLAAYEADLSKVKPWDQVRDNILKKFRNT